MGEEFFGTFGVGTGEGGVASLVHEELLIAVLGCLRVQGEGVLALRLELGIVAEHVPVTALHSLFHLDLAVGHAALDGVHLTGGVADDQGGARIGLCLTDGVEGLCLVGTHGDLRHIDIAVLHGDFRQGLLSHLLTSGGELCHLTDVGRLRGLTASVGVDFGVEDEDVHILTRGKHMVHTTVADVVSPTVATENPHGLLDEVVGTGDNFFCQGSHIASGLLTKCEKCFASGLRGIAIVEGLQPSFSGNFQLVRASGHRCHLSDEVCKLVTLCLLTDEHTKTVLGIVFKQGVCPGRTLAVFVNGVGGGGGRATPDRGTACGVGDEHAIAIELGDDTGIGGLGTACAGARELQIGLEELTALHGLGVGDLGLGGDLFGHIVEHSLLCGLALLRDHLQCVCRTGLYAHGTAHTVQGRDSQGELIQALALASLDGGRPSGLGGGGHLCFAECEGTDGGMGADIGTLVTLDTLALNPDGHRHRYATLFIGRSALAEGAVLEPIDKGRHRQGVATHLCNGLHDVLHHLHQKCLALEGGLFLLVLGSCPGGRHVELHIGLGTQIDGLMVHVNHVLTLFEVGLGGGILHIANGLIKRHDVGQLEEGAL